MACSGAALGDAATESGKTGAMQSICKSRIALNVHTLPGQRERAPASTRGARAAPAARARRSPTRSASRGVASAPSAVAMPEAKRINPPTSSVDRRRDAERRQDLRQDRGEEEDLDRSPRGRAGSPCATSRDRRPAVAARLVASRGDGAAARPTATRSEQADRHRRRRG